jgi:hypothetical protein
MVERRLTRDVVDGKTYWFSSLPSQRPARGTAFLLALYDEYLIAYRDRRAALDRTRWARITSRDPFSAPIVLDGQVVGGWKRVPARKTIGIRLMPFMKMAKSHVAAIADAARAYAMFLGVDSTLSWD